MTRRRRRATTLIEMMVACVLFFIFISLAGSLIVDMLRCYREGEIIVRPMQETRDAMSFLVDSFHNAYNVTWNTVDPINITVQVYADDLGHTARFEQFYHDRPNQQLVLLDFKDGPVFPSQIRTLLHNVRSLDIRHYQNDVVWTIDLVDNIGNTTTTPLHLQSLIFTRAYMGQP